MFCNLNDMDVVSVLMVLVTACVAKIDWNARPDFDWFPCVLDEGMISVFCGSVTLRPLSFSDEHAEGSGMTLKRPKYHGIFASCGILEAYARKAWKQFMNTGSNLTDLPMSD